MTRRFSVRVSSRCQPLLTRLNELSAASRDLVCGNEGLRHPVLDNKRSEVIRMVRSGKKTAADAARLFGTNRSTISRLLAIARHNPRPAITRNARKQRRR